MPAWEAVRDCESTGQRERRRESGPGGERLTRQVLVESSPPPPPPPVLQRAASARAAARIEFSHVKDATVVAYSGGMRGLMQQRRREAERAAAAPERLALTLPSQVTTAPHAAGLARGSFMRPATGAEGARRCRRAWALTTSPWLNACRPPSRLRVVTRLARAWSRNATRLLPVGDGWRQGTDGTRGAGEQQQQQQQQRDAATQLLEEEARAARAAQRRRDEYLRAQGLADVKPKVWPSYPQHVDTRRHYYQHYYQLV
jgi:hypothetical protein